MRKLLKFIKAFELIKVRPKFKLYHSDKIIDEIEFRYRQKIITTYLIRNWPELVSQKALKSYMNMIKLVRLGNMSWKLFTLEAKTKVMKYLKLLVIPLFMLGCSNDDSNDTGSTSKNGFTLDGKFYPITHAIYYHSGDNGTNDYTFVLADKKILDEANGISFENSKNSKMNLFIMSDLTLRGNDLWVDNYFHDRTESILGGVDSFNYYADQLIDANGNAVSPPDADVINSGTAKILSKSGNTFEFDYDVSFGSGAHTVGYFKGDVQLIEN